MAASEQRFPPPSDELLAALRAALNRHDPIQLIAIGCPEDEYDPELSELAAKLPACRSARDTLWKTHGVFCRWFGDRVAGPREGYEALAEELWHLKAKYYSDE